MGINFKDALGVHADALALRADRTRVLAANIANENTPGFQAMDMDFGSALQQLLDSEAGMLSTDDDATSLYRVPYQPSRDGNTVEMQNEQIAFSENAVGYSATLQFIRARVDTVTRALKGD